MGGEILQRWNVVRSPKGRWVGKKHPEFPERRNLARRTKANMRHQRLMSVSSEVTFVCDDFQVPAADQGEKSEQFLINSGVSTCISTGQIKRFISRRPPHTFAQVRPRQSSPRNYLFMF